LKYQPHAAILYNNHSLIASKFEIIPYHVILAHLFLIGYVFESIYPLNPAIGITKTAYIVLN